MATRNLVPPDKGRGFGEEIYGVHHFYMPR